MQPRPRAQARDTASSPVSHPSHRRPLKAAPSLTLHSQARPEMAESPGPGSGHPSTLRGVLG